MAQLFFSLILFFQNIQNNPGQIPALF